MAGRLVRSKQILKICPCGISDHSAIIIGYPQTQLLNRLTGERTEEWGAGQGGAAETRTGFDQAGQAPELRL
jgi:hypothetical protein